MTALPSVTQPLTLGFALRAFGQRCLAKLAGYNAAYPTPTTTVGTRVGTNSNSTFAQMQRVGMMWTAEDVTKNSPIAGGYLAQRQNYCSSMIRYKADTGDEKLDDKIEEYLHGNDGCGGVFSTMGMDCAMQDAFLRTADLELPVRGDAGLIWHRAWDGSLHLMEFSADQLGEIYNYSTPRATSLASDSRGNIVEVTGNDVMYYCGRYFKNGFCIAYKIYDRQESWYGNPRIYAAQDVIYFQDPASFRGRRGVTMFANAIQHMEKGENLFQIGMDAALRQSKTAYAVFNERGQPDELTYDNQQYSDGRVVARERINSGPLVEYFYTGDKVQATSADSPGPELIAGCEFSDQRVALALRLNYAFLVSPEKVGGAPSRLEVEKATKEFDRIKNDIHRPALNRIRNTVLLDAMNKGVFPYDYRVLRGYFNLPISPTVDAYYDSQAEIRDLRSGVVAPQEVCAKTNRNWDVVRRLKKQAAKQVAIDAQDANRELKDAGYKPTITDSDIMQLSDNPQTETPAGEPEPKTETQPKQKALMAAYLGDVSVSTLPEGTRQEVMRILGLQSNPQFLRVVKYGMVADELERMADPMNLESAQRHLKYCTNGNCADEVYANEEKHILVNNGRIVDGHHYLAKALKGRVTKSLHVIDITPARFQTAA